MRVYSEFSRVYASPELKKELKTADWNRDKKGIKYYMLWILIT